MLVGGIYKISAIRDERVFVVKIDGIREDDDWFLLDRAYYGVIMHPDTHKGYAITILEDMWDYSELSSLELALL